MIAFSSSRSAAWVGVLWRALGGGEDSTYDDGRIKARDVRPISVVVFQRVIQKLREVRPTCAAYDFELSSTNPIG
jgi:hypothetical protein